MLSEDLEFLEAFVRNSNNRVNGSIISAVTSADETITALPAMVSMSLATYSEMRAVRSKPGSTFFTASQMAKNSSSA